MTGPRFVFLSRSFSDSPSDHRDVAARKVTWMALSPNSRPLGKAATWYDDVDECRAGVMRLRESLDDLHVAIVVTRGRWVWRADRDGEPIAVSVRDYLRQHECDYNVRRFLEAVPTATLPAVVRAVRSGSCTP